MNRAACLAILVAVLAVAAVPAHGDPLTPAAVSGANSLSTFEATGEVVVELPGAHILGSKLRFKGQAYIDHLDFAGGAPTGSDPYGEMAMVEVAGSESEVTSQSYSGVATMPANADIVTITGSASSKDGTIAGTFRAEDVELGEEFADDNIDIASTAVAVSGHFTTLTSTLVDGVSGKAVTYETNYEISSLDAAHGVADVVSAGRLSAQEPTSSLAEVNVVEPETSGSGFGLLLLGLGGTCGTALFRRRQA